MTRRFSYLTSVVHFVWGFIKKKYYITENENDLKNEIILSSKKKQFYESSVGKTVLQ